MGRLTAHLKVLWEGFNPRDARAFLFFFLLSGIFWVLQNLNETYEVDMQFPITLKGVPDDVVITTDLPPYANVSLSDRGTVLVGYMGGSLPPITVDFNLYDNGMETGRGLVSMSDLRALVERQLSSTTRVVAIESDTLEFFFNRGICRKLPVRMVGNIKTHPHNYLRSAAFHPDSVLVYAPKLVLDTMTCAYTEPVTLSNLTGSITQPVSMRHGKGVRCVPDYVDVFADVDYYTEKSVEVPIVGLNFPADKSLRTFPGSVRVTFRIGASHYNDVTAKDFVLLITYDELLQNDKSKFHLTLKSCPEGVDGVRITPSEVDYLIEQSVEKGEEE